jgi:hypothetical protein
MTHLKKCPTDWLKVDMKVKPRDWDRKWFLKVCKKIAKGKSSKPPLRGGTSEQRSPMTNKCRWTKSEDYYTADCNGRWWYLTQDFYGWDYCPCCGRKIEFTEEKGGEK